MTITLQVLEQLSSKGAFLQNDLIRTIDFLDDIHIKHDQEKHRQVHPRYGVAASVDIFDSRPVLYLVGQYKRIKVRLS